MRDFKARISKLEKNIKLKKKLYKIYWTNGTFAGAMLDLETDPKISFIKCLN